MPSKPDPNFADAAFVFALAAPAALIWLIFYAWLRLLLVTHLGLVGETTCGLACAGASLLAAFLRTRRPRLS